MIVRSVASRGRGYAQSGAGPRRGSRGPIFIPIPGSWGSSGSSWSGGFRGGGGFSGGGGSFGGAGASGSFLFSRVDGLDDAVAPRAVGDGMISGVDKRRIAEAIRVAEEKTAGEIFCVIAHACGDYRLVPIAWSVLVALAVPLPLIYLTARPAGIIYLLQLAAFIVVALVLSLPMIRFRIVPKRRMWERAHAEAMHQFLAQGIHLTEHRTGVLIFASVAERYAEIVADSGINAKVQPDVWSKAVAAMISAIKDGRPGDGFVAAVELCGEQLVGTSHPAR